MKKLHQYSLINKVIMPALTGLVVTNTTYFVRNNQITFDVDKTVDISSVKCKYYTQNLDFLKKFSNTQLGIFYMYQILYWHDTEPDAVITHTQDNTIIFQLTLPHIINSVNNTSIVDRSLYSGIEQTGDYSDDGNSGSFSGGDTYKDRARIVDWKNILPDYINLATNQGNGWNPQDLYVNVNEDYLWHKGDSVNMLDSKVVFQKGDNPSYVYDNAKSHDFWFNRGISHDMQNKKFDIFGIPYVFAKEDYFTYVVYNFGARFIYTLQSEDTTTRDVNTEKNKTHWNQVINANADLLSTFDPSQVITVNSVDYNDHSLVWGINPEFTNLYIKATEMYNSGFYDWFDNLVKKSPGDLMDTLDVKHHYYDGKINIDNINQLEQCQSVKTLDQKLQKIDPNNDATYGLYQKYNFLGNKTILQSIASLKDDLSVTLTYTIFNPVIQNYQQQSKTFNYNDLVNNKVRIPLNKDTNNEYYFQINDFKINRFKDEYTYIPESNETWKDTYASKHLKEDNDHYCLTDPIYVNANFDNLPSDLMGYYPSFIDKSTLVNKYVHLIDDQGITTNVTSDDYPLVDLQPDDVHGTLKVTVHTSSNEETTHTYSGFKQFDIDKFTNIDTSKYQYGKVASDITISDLDNYLDQAGFDNNILNNCTSQITEVDDQNGIVKLNLINNQYSINKTITFSGFAPCYLEQINNDKILSEYKPSKVTQSMVRQYLLRASDGFTNKYGTDYQVKLQPNDSKNTLNVTIDTDSNQTYSFTYQFQNSKNIITYICIGIIALGIIGIVAFLLMHRKKVVQKQIKQ